MLFPPSRDIPVYDFHFNRVPQPIVLRYRSIQTDKLWDQCWTLKDLSAKLKKDQQIQEELLAAKIAQQKEETRIKAQKEKERKKAIEAAKKADSERITKQKLAVEIEKAKRSEEDQKRKQQEKQKQKKDSEKKENAAKIPKESKTAESQTNKSGNKSTKKGESDKRVDANATKQSNEKIESADARSDSQTKAESTRSADTKKSKKKSETKKTESTTESKVDNNHSKSKSLVSTADDSSISSVYSDTNPTSIRQSHLLSAVASLIKTYSKSNWLTVLDSRFGFIAHFIESKVDADSSVTASHSDEAILKYSKENNKIKQILTVDIDSMKELKDKQFDFIVGLETFSSSQKSRFESIIKEMLRISKKGVLLIEPHNTPSDSSFSKEITHVLRIPESITPIESAIDAHTFITISQSTDPSLQLFFRQNNDKDDKLYVQESGKVLVTTLLLKKKPSDYQMKQLTKIGFVQYS